MSRAASKKRPTVSAATPKRPTSSRVKSSRSKVVVSENIGLSKRMFFNCTMRIGDLAAPIAAAALDHADRKAVQRDVEDMAAGAAEPRRQPPQLGMLLQQQHRAAGAGQHVGGRQPRQSRRRRRSRRSKAGRQSWLKGEGCSRCLRCRHPPALRLPLVRSSLHPSSLQQVAVGDADAAEDGADDAHQPLVVAADEEVAQVRGAVVAFFRRRRKWPPCRGR